MTNLTLCLEFLKKCNAIIIKKEMKKMKIMIEKFQFLVTFIVEIV
jgi:hypothetical protein